MKAAGVTTAATATPKLTRFGKTYVQAASMPVIKHIGQAATSFVMT
jgi:hypothetical protein